MKYNILFSIPVHERFDVILDQLLNITILNPNCAIVLHISKVFEYDKSPMSKEEFFKAIKGLKLNNIVFINPESVRTGACDIIQAHLSNFNYARKLFEFEYFSMLSSNELFVKAGLYNKVNKYYAGCSKQEVNSNRSWVWTKFILGDKKLNAMLKKWDAENIYSSQIEGSYYKFDIFVNIANTINEYYNYLDEDIFYPREEVYFSALYWAIIQKKRLNDKTGNNFTFIPWFRNSLTIYFREVIKIIKKSNHYFSIKRIPREIDDPIRCYLRLYYNYLEREKKFNPSLPNYKNREFLVIKGYIKEIRYKIAYLRLRLKILFS